MILRPEEKIIQKLIKTKNWNEKLLAGFKRLTAKESGTRIIKNTDLIKAYKKLVSRKKVKENQALKKFLRKRSVRTLSGVAVIAVLTKPYPCPGKCIYCPTEKQMPKSYLSNEPAVMRAILCKFDPHKQVRMRLAALEQTGHPTDKIELIVMGGTWSCLTHHYQNWFIQRCFEACNNRKSKDLGGAQKINETAKHRIIGLTLETRPDYVTPEEIKRMRELGCTRVEIGVQSLDDKILKLNKRGHTVKQTIQATRLLKEAGFKICYHLMPNLPGSTPAKDLKMFKELFTNPNFQPDMLKIYPCVVTKDSIIHKWWQRGKYQPYSEKQLTDLLIKTKQSLPYYVRINRLIRDIPSNSIEAGNKISNLRQNIQKKMKAQGLECKCIRCREIGHHKDTEFKTKNPKLFTTKYKASDGIEHFLSFESKDRKILYAFCRLRISSKKSQPIFDELKNAALIRELHTYGHLVPISKSGKVQHTGLGKKLMQAAEKIATKSGYQKIAVIAGIGVRKYYRKLGYRQEGTYMVKYL